MPRRWPDLAAQDGVADRGVEQHEREDKEADSWPEHEGETGMRCGGCLPRQEQRREVHCNRLLAPQVRTGEIDQLVAAAAHHRSHHIECKAFGHLQGDRGRHRKLGAVHDRIDQNRPVVV